MPNQYSGARQKEIGHPFDCARKLSCKIYAELDHLLLNEVAREIDMHSSVTTSQSANCYLMIGHSCRWPPFFVRLVSFGLVLKFKNMHCRTVRITRSPCIRSNRRKRSQCNHESPANSNEKCINLMGGSCRTAFAKKIETMTNGRPERGDADQNEKRRKIVRGGRQGAGESAEPVVDSSLLIIP